MKKKLMLVIMILAPFVVITNASALTQQQQDLVDMIYDKDSDIRTDYPNCAIINDSFDGYSFYYTCFPTTADVKYESSTTVYCNSTFNYIRRQLRCGGHYPTCSLLYSQARTCDQNSYLNITTNSNGFLVNFDLYKTNGMLGLSSSWSFSSLTPQLYIITFNPPKNTTIEVKDSDNNIIQPESQYIYKLESGTYTYSATNNLYQSKTNITFQVSGDATINVEMEEKLQSQPIRSVYTQYYNYISELVSKVFDIENPIFLFFISFMIGFSLIILIKRLIGGIL